MRQFVLLGIVALGIPFQLGAADASAPSAQEALSKLREGNARFVAGKPKHEHTGEQWRRSLVKGQHPFAVIVSCSDSRVPTELVFDRGFGDRL